MLSQADEYLARAAVLGDRARERAGPCSNRGDGRSARRARIGACHRVNHRRNPNAPVRIEMQTVPKTEWTKVCSKPQAGQKDLCFTTRDFTTAP